MEIQDSVERVVKLWCQA